MKTKRGFKVVGTACGGYHSCVEDGVCRVHYLDGQWVGRPKHGGPLAVFESARLARHFIDSEREKTFPEDRDAYCGHWQAWECEYEQSADDCLWDAEHGRWDNGWLPPGTVLADSVKLIRRVDDE